MIVEDAVLLAKKISTGLLAVTPPFGRESSTMEDKPNFQAAENSFNNRLRAGLRRVFSVLESKSVQSKLLTFGDAVDLYLTIESGGMVAAVSGVAKAKVSDKVFSALFRWLWKKKGAFASGWNAITKKLVPVPAFVSRHGSKVSQSARIEVADDFAIIEAQNGSTNPYAPRVQKRVNAGLKKMAANHELLLKRRAENELRRLTR